MALMQSPLAPVLVCRNDAAYIRKLWRNWSPGWQFSDEQFEPTRQAFTDPLIAWAATRYYRGLFTWQSPETRLALSALFKPLAVPALALAGQRDGCMGMPFHSAMALSARLQAKAGLQIVHLPGCGHFLQAEKPAETAAILLEHLSACS
jgi:pimeloyl-ACP methyl ester carboxylesterase